MTRVLTLAAVGMWTGFALAQPPAQPVQPAQPRIDNQPVQAQPTQPGESARQMSGLHAASQVIGLNVQTRTGEVGKVEDLLIDDHTQQVRYLVVNLGQQEKMLVVPASLARFPAHGVQERAVSINIQPDRLQQAPTFNSEAIHDARQMGWTSQVDEFYGVTWPQRREALRPGFEDRGDLEEGREDIRENIQERNEELRESREQIRDNLREQRDELREEAREAIED